MDKRRHKNELAGGFTLVEVIVALTIFIVTLGIIYSMFFAGLDVWGTGRVQSDLQANSRRALNYMVSELRNATRTSTQAPSPNLSIPPDPDNDGIIFYLPEDMDGDGLITDANGRLEWNISNPVQYQYLSADNQIRRIDNSGETTFAYDVSGLQFIDIDIDPALAISELRINLTLSRTTQRQRDISVSLSSILALRN